MKSFILFSVLLLIITASFCQTPQDLKFWHKDSVMVWNDFKGSPIHNDEHYASSNCNISYFFDIINDTIYFEVKSYLDREKSWKKKTKNAKNLLEHEQGHFDIAELYGRKLRKELFEFTIPERSITDTVKQIYKKNIEKYKIAQKEYDTITRSGLDNNSQQTYLNKLEIYLQELSKFQKTHYKRRMN
jgi:hypothetical protein